MKKLIVLFCAILLSSQVYSQSLSIVSAVDQQPTPTDFSAVSISNLYNSYTREFKVVVDVLGQTLGHNVAGFYLQIDIYGSSNSVLYSSFYQIANTMTGSIAPYTTFSSDYIIDYSTNLLKYVGPVVVPPGATSIVYRVISLNDPDLDNIVNSADISTIDYTTVAP